MWELDHREVWTPKKWCFHWTVVLEKTVESPLDRNEIKPVSLKGNQPWILIGRTDAETGAPIFWPPVAKSRLTEKVPNAGEGWGQEEKEATEDHMVGWHHWLNGHEFERTPEIVKDREDRWATVHGISKSWTRLSDWTTRRIFCIWEIIQSSQCTGSLWNLTNPTLLTIYDI